MPSANDLGMIDLDDLSNPISFRFHQSGGTGMTTTELTVDAPGVPPDLQILARFATLLWSSTIANAISAASGLIYADAVYWKEGPATLLVPTDDASGNIHQTPGPAAEAGVLTLHTNGLDKYSRRQIYCSYFPKPWRSDRVLTSSGLSGMYRAAAGMCMGLGLDILGGPLAWLIQYSDVIDRRPNNILGAAFRRVHHVRVQSYCEVPPVDDNVSWP